MNITVNSRSKTIKTVSTDEFNLNSLVKQLVQLISVSNNLSPHRIRLSYEQDGKRVPLQADKSFADNGIKVSGDKLVLLVKDLGPQIGWRTVYVIEYLGPIILHGLFYFSPWIYGQSYFPHSTVQTLVFNMTLVHYLKREFETLFVHKFSNATMPATNIFKNCGHYWLLSGVLTAYFSYAPQAFKSDKSAWTRFLYHTNDNLPSWAIMLLVDLFVFFETSNYLTHANLSSIRAKDDKKYQIPYGYGFNLVSCPNYFFEVMSWLAVFAMIGNWSFVVFVGVGAVQMYIWAIGKHKRYLKTFGDEYKKLKRKVMVPYLM